MKFTFVLLFAVLCIYGLDCEVRDLEWIRGTPVFEVFGPENATYCRVEDPHRLAVSDGFGRCIVDLNRASTEHVGDWRAIIGTPDQVHTKVQYFRVDVVDPPSKPVVTTSVEKDLTTFAVTLGCSVYGYDVYACKFRDPSGFILLANPGAEDNLYNHDAVSRYRSNSSDNSCTIEITNPTVHDLGLWRCALDTNNGTSYGFITVLCPWAMQDPDVAAVVESEPILAAERPYVNINQGDSVILSCSVNSAISYCYFRAQNGTIYPVGESTYNDFMQYRGSGFDAGECGVKFNNLLVSDSGEWSCHVGLTNNTAPEQNATIYVEIRAPILVDQYLDGNQLVVQGSVFVSSYQQLEFCRFVRIDGLGFTQSNMPEGYINEVYLPTGSCVVRVVEPTILDKHPWTVAARISGHLDEVYATTSHTLGNLMPDDSSGGIPLKCLLFTIFLSVGAIGLVGWFVVRKTSWYQSRCPAPRNSIQKVPLPDLPEYKTQPASNNHHSVNLTVAAA